MIYEDTIRGLQDFAGYLRRFGRSVIVDEPADLNEKIDLLPLKKQFRAMKKFYICIKRRTLLPMNSNHMYISEAFQDLGNLISILTNDAISATIEDISIILSIPVFRVREMIIQLSQFKELNGALVVEPVISSDENNFFSSDSDSDPDFPSNIRAGYYDQQAFRLILREDAFISHNQFLFQCDNLEYRMLTSEYPELKKSISSQPYYMVKESPFTPPIEKQANNEIYLK